LALGAEILVLRGGSNRRPGVRRVETLPESLIEVGQVLCTDGATTLCDLARELDDQTFEQVLESALRRRAVKAADVERIAVGPSRGAARVRRVIKARGGLAVAPTESLLETLMLQLIRSVPGLPARRSAR
jgi:hypothetical protein